MKRRKYFALFVIVLIFLCSSSISARASSYQLGITQGNEFTWRVSHFNSSAAVPLGIDPSIEIGMQRKIVITSIQNTSNDWIINGTFWSYLTEFSESSNPTSFLIGLAPSSNEIGQLFLPTPLATYLLGINATLAAPQLAFISIEKVNSETYNSIKVKISGETIYYVYEYDVQSGVLLSLTYYHTGNIVYRTELERWIIGYDMGLIILLLGMVGIFYIHYKKKEII